MQNRGSKRSLSCDGEGDEEDPECVVDEAATKRSRQRHEKTEDVAWKKVDTKVACDIVGVNPPTETSFHLFSCMTYAVLGSIGLLDAEQLGQPNSATMGFVQRMRALIICFQATRIRRVARDGGNLSHFFNSVRTKKLLKYLENDTGTVGFDDAMLGAFATLFDVDVVLLRCKRVCDGSSYHFLEVYKPNEGPGKCISLIDLRFMVSQRLRRVVVLQFEKQVGESGAGRRAMGHYTACPPLDGHGLPPPSLQAMRTKLLAHCATLEIAPPEEPNTEDGSVDKSKAEKFILAT